MRSEKRGEETVKRKGKGNRKTVVRKKRKTK